MTLSRHVYLLIASLLTPLFLSAETFFTLKGVDRVYPVVEIGGTKVPKSAKTYIRNAIGTITGELGIRTDGYSQRSLALLVSEEYTAQTPVINVRLVIGEQVRREGSDAKIFAITYENAIAFAYDAKSVEENVEDAADELLETFADQYSEERTSVKRISSSGEDIASVLAYETDYAAAIAKAKSEHKNVMLVLVSNFCPWCRKFEQDVLSRTEVDRLVHEKYVPVILNKEKDAFPAELNLAFTPIVHFIDPATLKSYHTTVGYNERDAFLHWLKSDEKQ